MSDANLEKDLNATGDVFKYLHGSMKVRVMGGGIGDLSIYSILLQREMLSVFIVPHFIV